MAEARLPILTPGADRFKVIGLLSKSRYKLVTLVMDLSNSRQMVARLLRQPPGATEVGLLEGIARLESALKKVSHPSLPHLEKVVEGEGGTWMMFTFERGTVLAQYIGHEARIANAWLIWWLQHLLQALDVLHTQTPPMVVGYIEPSDIVVRGDRLVLADLALFEQIFPEIGALGGHRFLNFIAPEKRVSPQSAPACDLYSAGAMAFWLATGMAPSATGPSSSAAMLKALKQHRGDLPEAVSELIAQLLEFYPSQRPASAQDCLDRLAPFVSDMSGQTEPEAPLESDFKEAAAATRVIKEPAALLPVFEPPGELTDRPVATSATPRSPVAVAAVAAAVVLLGAIRLWQAHGSGPYGSLPMPMHVLSGQLRTARGGTQLAPGVETFVAETAALHVDQSDLSLQPQSVITVQGWDGKRMAFDLTAGVLHARTGPGDSMEVRLPGDNVLDVGESSDALIDLSGPGTVTCKKGAATLLWQSITQPIHPGDTQKLNRPAAP